MFTTLTSIMLTIHNALTIVNHNLPQVEQWVRFVVICQHNLSPARVGAFVQQFSLFLESLCKMHVGDFHHKIIPSGGEVVK